MEPAVAIGACVLLVARADRAKLGRGTARFIEHDFCFQLLIEARDDIEWFGARAGGLFQVSLSAEAVEVMMEAAR